MYINFSYIITIQKFIGRTTIYTKKNKVTQIRIGNKAIIPREHNTRMHSTHHGADKKYSKKTFIIFITYHLFQNVPLIAPPHQQ